MLSARNYTTSCTQQHPQGITFSSKFLNRIDRKFGKGKVVGAKTGYVNQSRYCAVSMYESEANKNIFVLPEWQEKPGRQYMII